MRSPTTTCLEVRPSRSQPTLTGTAPRRTALISTQLTPRPGSKARGRHHLLASPWLILRILHTAAGHTIASINEELDRYTKLTTDQAGADWRSDWRTRGSRPRALLRRSSDVSRERPKRWSSRPAKIDTDRDKTLACVQLRVVPPVGLSIINELNGLVQCATHKLRTQFLAFADLSVALFRTCIGALGFHSLATLAAARGQ